MKPGPTPDTGQPTLSNPDPTPALRKVLILGADGFIGRHLAFGLRQAGWKVIASARRTSRLEQMGFATLRGDLTDPATHDPAFWAAHLRDVDFVVNAVGLLTASETQFNAVHCQAPQALYSAMPPGTRGLLISAVGIFQIRELAPGGDTI